MTRPPAPDQGQRDAAVRERRGNVLVDAGAGTGKTTLLVERILELVAPEHGGAPVPLGRIAAITFTRKAAGELKFRIREALLRASAEPGLDPARAELLGGAASAIDTAWVGTIHAFADRLLRMRPVEARLSPSYEIAEDPAALHAEAFDLVMLAVELGTLAEVVEGPFPRELALEAEATLADAVAAGLRTVTAEYPHGERIGLDRLFERFAETRDVVPLAPPPQPPDLEAFRRLVGELGALAGRAGNSPGSRFVGRLYGQLARLAKDSEPVPILAGLLRAEDGRPRNMAMSGAFADDVEGWDAWKAWSGDTRRNAARRGCLRDEIAGPFLAWMARRLVRCAPLVVAAYERVKRRHRAVDQVDLLLQLRDLLRDDREARAGLQSLFDQILVDEFQDTDPLQAEIVLYLCERGARAGSWREVVLEPGKLTIVGDPKQSIYRFRRADIEVYDRVRSIVKAGPHLEASLQANFRCAPRLVDWLNDRFDGILGRAGGADPGFDAAKGTVANVPLLAGRAGGHERGVVTLPIASPGDDRVDAIRRVEARALATFLRATVDRGERKVVDPVTGARRAIRFGDVAILTAATTRLRLLFPELDRLGIPYAVRGSKLFLEDALHRQFVLGLRWLADREDGVAEAALFRAPFFAVDLDDLARAKADPADPSDPGVLRARAARELALDLRRRRLERSPGETARDLLETTAFARAVALGANGAQRLAALHELCLRLDALASSEGLDFDGATQRMRAWVEDPIELDPPRPVGDEALQILSIHQAKGLEWPLVALWDSRAPLSAREDASPFAVDRDGAAWALRIDGLEWSEPAGGDFAERERAYRDAERLRLVYVAATRARDWLVLPVAEPAQARWVTGRLAGGAPSDLVDELAAYAPGAEPAWAAGIEPPARPEPASGAALHSEVSARWLAAGEEAGRPRLAPTSVTAEARRPPVEAEEDAGPRFRRESRFGPVFGETVHRAIGFALGGLAPGAAVARAAAATGLAEHLAVAAADVDRATEALARAGLRRPPGPDLRLEYPVALAEDGGAKLVQGYLDLVGVRRDPGDGRLAVVDFKTDAPPPAGADVRVTHAAYVSQVTTYARILVDLGLHGQEPAPVSAIEAGLLFTADGEIRWVG